MPEVHRVGGLPARGGAGAAEAARGEPGPGLPKPNANPRHLGTIEGGRVYQAPYLESKSVSDALCRVEKGLRRSV